MFNTNDKKDLFAEALRANEGNVSKACAVVGISRPTFYNWRKQDPDFWENVLKEDDNDLVNLAKAGLKRLILQDNVQAVIFTLKTKGGFIEASKLQIEATVEESKSFDYSKLSMSALEELSELMNEQESGIIECLGAYPHHISDVINDTQSMANDDGVFSILPNNGRE
jgi:hypothetical protein